MGMERWGRTDFPGHITEADFVLAEVMDLKGLNQGHCWYSSGSQRLLGSGD